MTDLSLPTVSAALLADADRLLLAPSDLDHAKLSEVLAAIHARDVDFADLYFQHARFESWNLEEGIVKSGSFNIDRGVGVRAVAGDKQAYAYSDDISLAALEEAASAVRAIGRQGQSTSTPLGRRGGTRNLYPFDDPVSGLSESDKVFANVLAVKEDLALGGFEQPDQHLYRCAFSRTVRTQASQDLPRF